MCQRLEILRCAQDDMWVIMTGGSSSFFGGRFAYRQEALE